MIKSIMLPVDGSSFSEKAGEHAIFLAKGLNAKLTAVHVLKLGNTQKLDDENIENAKMKEADTVFSSIKEKATKQSVEMETKILVSRDIVETILEEAKDGNYDVIVMGSHGLSGLKKLILGSVTEEVLKRSTIPVFVSR
ncbi:universal stress protein [Candidatus Woesearchaeota archaeon]|jgi:nucleotide-binding universal stress UspA family protein|nr:universal stress protein [Candidatus Woesearchaeota archaeon]MDP6647996.1 universal stress protein [Candidatus Woesearchaeota archaeon]|tara:strand:+ start:34016 stop:34432 length:417 start_codon:yes stop_codon:yes gene_type:complete